MDDRFAQTIKSMVKRLVASEYVRVSAVLLFLLLVFFYKPIFTADTIVPFDAVREFDTLYQAENVRANNYLLTDVVHQMVPYKEYARNQLRSGIMPFINTHQAFGIPFFEDPQSRIFEFSNVLLLPFSFSTETLFLLSALITLYVAGICTYAFVRALGMRPFVALFAGISFMFSGPMIVWLQYPLASSVMWLPAILLALEKILTSRDIRFYALLLAATVFLIFSGQPQMVFLIGIFAIAYGVYRFFSASRLRSRNSAMPIVIIVLCAIGIAAFQLFPSLAYISRSSAYENGRGPDRNESAEQIAIQQISHPKEQVAVFAKRMWNFGGLFILPNLHGNPMNRDYVFPEKNNLNNYNELAVHFGLLGFAGLLGSLFLLKRKKVIFWLGASAITGGMAFFLPIIGIVNYLPIINKIHTGRFRFILVFSCIIAACYFFEFILLKIQKIPHVFIAGFVICLFSFINLFCVFGDYNRGAGGPNFPDHEILAWLEAHEGRFVALGKAGGTFRSPIIPNFATLFNQLEDGRVSNPLRPKEYDAMVQDIFVAKGGYVLLDNTEDFLAGNLFGISYVICEKTACGKIASSEDFTEVFSSSDFSIFKDQRALPLVYSRSGDASGPVPFSKNGSYLASSAYFSENTELIVQYAAIPGWRAYIDAKEVPIGQTAENFISLAVPQGEHTIQLLYIPKNFPLWLAISALSIIFLVGIFIFPQLRRIFFR